MTKSSENRTSRKVSRPQKPYPDFPLTPHNSGKWMKKIRNPVNGKPKIHDFGRWGKVVNGRMQRLPGDGWQEALELYKSQADDLHAGKTPRAKDPEGLTLRDLCNRYLTAKTRQKAAGEFSTRSFQDVKQSTDRLIAFFGLDRSVDDIAADDFGRIWPGIGDQFGFPMKSPASNRFSNLPMITLSLTSPSASALSSNDRTNPFSDAIRLKTARN